MKENKTKPNGILPVRVVSAVLLLACLVLCVCGCGKKDPEDTSFYIAKDENGAEFRLGEKGKTIGRMELPKAEDGEYSGDMKLCFGDEIWMRVWQEEDRDVQKVYLQSPDGAMQLASWAKGETPVRTKVRYNGTEEEAGSGRGVSLSMEFPQVNDDTGYLLFDIDEEGTLQLNLFLDRKVSDSVIEQISETFIYRFTDSSWGAQDRVASVARLLRPTTERNQPSGTYTISVDITRDGTTRQLRWERAGLGEEGYRFLTTCAQDGEQTARMQTLSDTLGDVIVENAVFAGEQLFAVDADGRVRRDGTSDLLTGLTAAYAFGYNGIVLSEQSPETLKTGTASGFAVSLVRMDEIYSGDRGEDALLTRPKYRKYLCLRFGDELSKTTVDVPLAYGEWIETDADSVPAETAAGQLSLLSQGPVGWELLCGLPSSENEPVPAKVGAIKTDVTVDLESLQVAYTGDVQVTVPGASDLRLYRRCDGETCYVYAEFSGYRWLLATCPAQNGEAPVLNVSRYVELDDYTTPLTVYKLIYSVRLPDETEIAQFLTTNDGRLVVRLKADPTLADREWDTAEDSEPDSETENAVDGSAQDGETENAADGSAPDGADGDAEQAFVSCSLLQGAKPTDITLEYAFRIRNGGEAGPRPKDIVIYTSVSESIVRNGNMVGTATELCFGDESSPVKIVADKGVEHADALRFVCYDGAEEEASLCVETEGDGTVSIREFTLTDRVTDEKQSPIRVKGGLLYVGDTCVDTLPAENLRNAAGNGSAKEYRPFEEWTSLETEHLVIRVRTVREYQDAVKSKDGTVITPASARRVVWAEITERSSGVSRSYPVGYGSWQTLPE